MSTAVDTYVKTKARAQILSTIITHELDEWWDYRKNLRAQKVRGQAPTLGRRARMAAAAAFIVWRNPQLAARRAPWSTKVDYRQTVDGDVMVDAIWGYMVAREPEKIE